MMVVAPQLLSPPLGSVVYGRWSSEDVYLVFYVLLNVKVHSPALLLSGGRSSCTTCAAPAELLQRKSTSTCAFNYVHLCWGGVAAFNKQNPLIYFLCNKLITHLMLFIIYTLGVEQPGSFLGVKSRSVQGALSRTADLCRMRWFLHMFGKLQSEQQTRRCNLGRL